MIEIAAFIFGVLLVWGFLGYGIWHTLQIAEFPDSVPDSNSAKLRHILSFGVDINMFVVVYIIFPAAIGTLFYLIVYALNGLFG